MREALYREIDMEYARIREENRREEQRRLEEATLADPAIGALVESRVALLHNRARDAFASPESALTIGEVFGAEIASIQARLRKALEAARFPQDYLQPVFRCALCRDSGFVGEPIRERCVCFLKKVRGRAARTAGQGLDPRETFEAYDGSVFPDRALSEKRPEPQRAFMERLRERCEAYADRFPDNERRNLLFFGGSGLGKTYLLNCVGNRARERGFDVVKLTAYQLTERMRASIFAHDEEAFAPLIDVPLLLLDDLGAEPLIANITIEQLFTLLNERGLRGRATAVSTNLMLDELSARYTERVASRLFDRRNTMIVEFLGADVRLK